MPPQIVLNGNPRPLVIHNNVTTPLVIKPLYGPGAPGPQGPPGPPGAETSFYHLHQQSVPAFVWTVNHNLSLKPNVSTFQSDDSCVEGDIVHVTANQLTITFGYAISGFAILS